jgi:hypothetical protein
VAAGTSPDCCRSLPLKLPMPCPGSHAQTERNASAQRANWTDVAAQTDTRGVATPGACSEKLGPSCRAPPVLPPTKRAPRDSTRHPAMPRVRYRFDQRTNPPAVPVPRPQRRDESEPQHVPKMPMQ